MKASRQLSKRKLLDTNAARIVGRRYAIGVTDHVLDTITHNDDAIAKQYLPDIRELKILPGENPDPIGDDVHSPIKGIVHRYPDRVLLKLLHACAVYCRFCFRREMVGQGKGMLKTDERNEAIDFIRDNPAIWEVILTGGDPLVLSPRQLKDSLDQLCAIDHVKVIRLHTRVPAADPARITDELCETLRRDKAVYVVIHINHPQELTPAVEAAFKKLHAAGCVLLSQSVLLKGVNDDAAVLESLFRSLTALRVKPYYLHHPDMAPGTSHFRLSIRRGQKIMRQLLGLVSGLCQPHYMLDIPGGHGKIPIGPSYLHESGPGTYVLGDYKGEAHHYTESHDD
jgi:lysine 2,3-aminomutase